MWKTDNTDFAQIYNVVYETVCPNNNCKKSYIGETSKRLSIKAKEYLGEKSHPGQHIIRTGHKPVTDSSSGFKLPNDRKIVGALIIRLNQASMYKKHQLH